MNLHKSLIHREEDPGLEKKIKGSAVNTKAYLCQMMKIWRMIVSGFQVLIETAVVMKVEK